AMQQRVEFNLVLRWLLRWGRLEHGIGPLGDLLPYRLGGGHLGCRLLRYVLAKLVVLVEYRELIGRQHPIFRVREVRLEPRPHTAGALRGLRHRRRGRPRWRDYLGGCGL